MSATANVDFLWAMRAFGVGAPSPRGRRRGVATEPPDWAETSPAPAPGGFVRALVNAFRGVRA